MADPWSDDLAALGEHSRQGLHSLAATRASVPSETKMRFHKAHPALAALIALLVIGVTAPLAYAFVRHVLVTVDPDKPADQIEKDVTDQLHTAGVEATVKATTADDGQLKVYIQTSDEHLGSDLDVNIGGEVRKAGEGRGIRVECHECDAAREQLVMKAATTVGVLEVIDDDAAVGPAITKALADAGVTDVEVKVAPDAITVVVGAAAAATQATPARP